MIVNFFSQFRETEKQKPNRYDYSLKKLASKGDEQVIALAMIYHYLACEVTGKDEWDQMKRVLTGEEIYKLFTGVDADEFLTPTQIAFFKENYDLFVKHLGNKQ